MNRRDSPRHGGKLEVGDPTPRNGNRLDDGDRFTDEIGKQAKRAKRGRQVRWWQGLGVLGSVGWMVVAPTLAGIALGRFLDGQFHSGIFWTLSLLLLGITIGCAVAWKTVKEGLS